MLVDLYTGLSFCGVCRQAYNALHAFVLLISRSTLIGSDNMKDATEIMLTSLFCLGALVPAPCTKNTTVNFNANFIWILLDFLLLSPLLFIISNRSPLPQIIITEIMRCSEPFSLTLNQLIFK